MERHITQDKKAVSSPKRPSSASDRQARLAQALRDNLKKRKAQTRLRRDLDDSSKLKSE